MLPWLSIVVTDLADNLNRNETETVFAMGRQS